MKSVLYIAKMNLISDDIFNVYDDIKALKKICNDLFIHLEDDIKYVDKIPQTFNGITTYKEIKYRLHILHKSDSDNCIDGCVYKDSYLYFKKYDEITKIPINDKVENTEMIRFYFDVDKECVCFYKTQRFGYQDFVKAFTNLINVCMENKDISYRFNFTLINKGMSINEIKTELKKIHNIEEIIVKMQTPNPKQELLDKISKDMDEQMKKYKESNITMIETKYISKGKTGLNIDGEIIEDCINNIDDFNKYLTSTEATANGYITVTATNRKGEKFSTEESKPAKGKWIKDNSFADDCKQFIKRIFS